MVERTIKFVFLFFLFLSIYAFAFGQEIPISIKGQAEFVDMAFVDS